MSDSGQSNGGRLHRLDPGTQGRVDVPGVAMVSHGVFEGIQCLDDDIMVMSALHITRRVPQYLSASKCPMAC